MAALEGLTQAEIARRTGRHRETIAELPRGDAFERVREEVISSQNKKRLRSSDGSG
jgi:hypothetical protein